MTSEEIRVYQDNYIADLWDKVELQLYEEHYHIYLERQKQRKEYQAGSEAYRKRLETVLLYALSFKHIRSTP